MENNENSRDRKREFVMDNLSQLRIDYAEVNNTYTKSLFVCNSTLLALASAAMAYNKETANVTSAYAWFGLTIGMVMGFYFLTLLNEARYKGKLRGSILEIHSKYLDKPYSLDHKDFIELFEENQDIILKAEQAKFSQKQTNLLLSPFLGGSCLLIGYFCMTI